MFKYAAMLTAVIVGYLFYQSVPDIPALHAYPLYVAPGASTYLINNQERAFALAPKKCAMTRSNVLDRAFPVSTSLAGGMKG